MEINELLDELKLERMQLVRDASCHPNKDRYAGLIAGVDIALAKVETFVKTQPKQQKIRQNSEQMALPGGGENSARLTKREHIAAVALQGLLANPSHSVRDAASNAVVVADELIAALNYYPVEEPDLEEFSVPIPGDPDYYEG